MAQKKKKVLIVEPHSDDGVISIGGFLEKFKTDYEYHFILITASDSHLNHVGGKISRETRMAEFQAYVDHFNGTWQQGKNDLLPLDADAKLDLFPRAKLVGLIEEIITQVKPHILIAQAPSFHHDHTAVYESVIAATRPTSVFCPEEIYIMENPTYVHSVGPQTDFKQDVYITLSSEDIDKKLACYRACFPSQIREESNYLSEEGVRSWARYRGIEARCDYAEALQTYIRRI